MMGVGAYRRTVRSDELLEELPGGEVGRNGLALPQNVLFPSSWISTCPDDRRTLYVKGTGKMYRECGFPRSARNESLGQ